MPKNIEKSVTIEYDEFGKLSRVEFAVSKATDDKKFNDKAIRSAEFELRQLGWVHNNAANYLKKIARENEIDRKTIESHNKRMAQQARERRAKLLECDDVDELEREIARLSKLLESKTS